MRDFVNPPLSMSSFYVEFLLRIVKLIESPGFPPFLSFSELRTEFRAYTLGIHQSYIPNRVMPIINESLRVNRNLSLLCVAGFLL